jgi:transcriptional regulator GlxA family with amidase domain
MTRIIELLVLDGAMPSSVALTLDILATVNRLRSANRESALFEVVLTGSGAVHWRPLVPPTLSVVQHEASHIIVPGLSLTNEQEVEDLLSRDDAITTQDRLIARSESATVATSCSGSFLVAKAGLLNGRRATTSWWLAPVFRSMFPDVQLDTDALLVEDGSYMTAGAALAQMDLMLALIGDWAGPAMAAQCGRYLLLDERRSQAHYMELSFLSASDPQVAKAEKWVRTNLDRSFAMDELADAVGMAPRTFARRLAKVTGLSPIKFVQKLRVEAAVDLLETSRLPIEDIALQVGYLDPAMLRQLITANTGLTPGKHRIMADRRSAR